MENQADMIKQQGVMDVWQPDELAVLEAAERNVPAFTPDQARLYTEQLRASLETIDYAIFALYVGMAWKSLGYSSWSEYCQKERLVTRFVRYDVPDRRKLHYELYQLRGMTGRAVGAVTGYDQKTVTLDVDRVILDMRQAGLTPPPRPARIQATNGSMRTVSARARMLPSQREDDPDNPVDPEAEEEAGAVTVEVLSEPEPIGGVDEVTVEGVDVTPDPAPAALPAPAPVAPSRRRRDWPEEYRDLTAQTRRVMERLQRLLEDRTRRDKYLPDVPDGDRKDWTEWAATIVEWATLLDGGSEE